MIIRDRPMDYSRILTAIHEKSPRRSLGNCSCRPLIAALAIALLPWTTMTSTTTVTAMTIDGLVHPPGAVYPHQLELQIGDDGNITCHITSIEQCRPIWFSEHNSGIAIHQPSERIKELNRNEFMLLFRNASEQMAQYQCMCNDSAIGQSNVYVGTAPLDVVDFRCISYDYEYMRCNFTRPSNNLETAYKLTYTINNTSDGVQSCPLTNGVYCYLPKYNPNRKVYTFNLTATNSAGRRSQIFIVDNHKSVLPPRLKIEMRAITSDSVRLDWKFHSLKSYDEKLIYAVQLNATDLYERKYNLTDVRCDDTFCSVTIGDLKYAYRWFRVSVRVRVATAPDDERMWSEPWTGVFMTDARRPDHPPRTAVGGYHIEQAETAVRLYWHALAVYEENGADFYYELRETDADGNETGAWNTTKSSLVVPWHRNDAFVYEIRAGNAMGTSQASSTILVYPNRRANRNYKPDAVAASYHNRKYTLSWKAPTAFTYSEMANYTIYWCQSETESPNLCRGTIYFDYIDKSATNFSTDPQNRTIIMAVSANYWDHNTGMHWAMCSSDVASDLIKLEPEVAKISASAITVRWDSGPVCPSILEGYNLTYCPETGDKCASSSIGKGLKNYTISELQPYTVYCVNMMMISLNALKIGPTSDRLCRRTQQAAPSAPRDLRVSLASVTSNSANVSWLPPILSNGQLQNYTIWKYNVRKPKQVDQTTLNMSDIHVSSDGRLVYELESLYSYTEFNVSVTARTILDSLHSNSVKFLTLIGTPSNPRELKTIKDGSDGVLEWMEPEMPSGRVEFYAVALTLVDRNNEMVKKVSLVRTGKRNVTVHRCRFTLKCSASIRTYYLSVRAVNVAEQHEIDHNTFQSNVKASTSAVSGSESDRARRHTRPEIRAAIVNGRQAHDITEAPWEDGMPRRRDTTSVSTRATWTETSTVGTQSNAGSSDIMDVASDFQCVGDYDVIEQRFKDYVQHERNTVSSGGRNGEFKYFSSPWEADTTRYQCYPDHTILRVGLYCLVSLIVCAIAYRVQKKWKKMKNIEAKLPVGLVHHITLNKNGNGVVSSSCAGIGAVAGSCGGGSVGFAAAGIAGDANDNYDNSMKMTLSELGHNNDWSLHKEFQQLLDHNEAITSTPVNIGCLQQKTQDAHKERNSSSSSLATQTLSGDPDCSSESIDSVELQGRNTVSYAYMLSTCTTPDASPTSAAAAVVRSVAPTEYQLPSVAAGHQVTQPMFNTNGYVTPSALMSPPHALIASDELPVAPVASNGYVLPQTLMAQQQQQPTDNSRDERDEQESGQATTGDGYITLDEMGKQIITPPVSLAPAAAPSAPISTNDNDNDGHDQLVTAVTQEKLQATDDDSLNGETNVQRAAVSTATNDCIGNNFNNDNSNLLCGYVTQRQLAEFGQLLHESESLDSVALRYSTVGRLVE